MQYDAFICHASEDKEDLARPLAEHLREQHIEVWYDEFTLKVGDSLRRSIDRGLSQSRFGIVILSPSFFQKQWSQWELDGLVARQNSSAAGVILPLWHQVGHQEIMEYSPPLADKIAIDTRVGIDEIVRRLRAVIRPEGSTLVIARDYLLEYGHTPPVISDDWWLDVAAAAESNDMEGGFQEAMGWGRWGFPLPEQSKVPSQRGWRMAFAAMQMMWQEEADSRPITQITPPDLVHEFIASQSGLDEVCAENLLYLISYAPQLVIRGFGSAYEEYIENRYQLSCTAQRREREEGSRSGTALTTDGNPPTCDELFVLRDTAFGNYEAPSVACGFVQGHVVLSGPPVKYYSTVDYAVWLLSRQSIWLPTAIREYLARGIAEWGVWPWDRWERLAIEDFGFEDQSFTGAFCEALEMADSRDVLHLGDDARRDLEHRVSFSARLLQLPETGEELSARLLTSDFLDHYYAEKRRRRAARQEKE